MVTTEIFDVISQVDGLKLNTAIIKPDEAIGIVQIAHGMAENKERYYDFMSFLAENGYVTVINDHRGHGKSIKSEDDLGYFYNDGAKAVVEDVHQITGLVKQRYPNLPFYLLGHSMGSLIVRAYAKKYDDELNGLIVSGCPSNNPASKAGMFLIKLLTLFKGDHYRSNICNNLFSTGFNKKYANEGSEFAWLSVNKDNVKKYEESNLCGFVFTLNGYKALLDLMMDVYSQDSWQMKNKSLPIWFISGEDDPCMIDLTSFIKAVDLMRNVGYTDVSYKIYKGMRHEILNEDDNITVYRDVLGMLNRWNQK